MDKLAALARKINYSFDDVELFKLALTHRSKGSKNYERLEFLGDSILGFVVADFLYKKFPHLAEGKLSRMRSSLVRKETLAAVARELGLSDHLILGEGELKSGGFNRDSILSDAVESLIGAIYLDSNFATANEFINRNFASQFEEISEQSNFKDPKSQLQEAMQKSGLSLPTYEIVEVVGDDHEQTFTLECVISEAAIRAKATAKSRRQAEQKAAADVLKKYSLLKQQ